MHMQGDFDVVYDNNGKDMASCKPLIDYFRVCAAETATVL